MPKLYYWPTGSREVRRKSNNQVGKCVIIAINERLPVPHQYRAFGVSDSKAWSTARNIGEKSSDTMYFLLQWWSSGGLAPLAFSTFLKYKSLWYNLCDSFRVSLISSKNFCCRSQYLVISVTILNVNYPFCILSLTVFHVVRCSQHVVMAFVKALWGYFIRAAESLYSDWLIPQRIVKSHNALPQYVMAHSCKSHKRHFLIIIFTV